MNTTVGHIQFNVAGANLPFYKELFSFLGWNTLYAEEGFFGVGNAQQTSLWFIGFAKDGVSNDYDGPGMNHLAISTETQADVDATASYLREQQVELLFGTPQHRPEFSSEGNTYYQVMFETPDRILLEVVYTGPKAE